MIPVSLKIKGLYSFQEEQTIDFKNLIDAKLFGIFGTVGSGKSTILEAISFALFGNTERLNSRDNRNYNMMNLKSDELLIDFEFTNHNDELYRFVVKGKRHGSEFSKVNSFTRSAYHRQDQSWVPLGSITAEEIVGLSYENFRRTIIIPQGQFQEFLELGDKDRTNMLKELFHLSKYDFFFQTASLEKKNNEKIQFLSGQLAQYEITTQENIVQKEIEVRALLEELSVLHKQLEDNKTLEKTQSELKKLFDDLKSKQAILVQLTSREPQILKQEKTLGRYESCVNLFKNQLKIKKETEAKLSEQKETVEQTKNQISTLIESLSLDQENFKSVEVDFKNLDHKKQQANDYHQLKVVLKLSADIAKLEERITTGETKLKEENTAREELQTKVSSHKKQIKEAREKLPNQAEMAEIKSWFTQKIGILKNIAAVTTEKNGFEKQLQEKQQVIQIAPALLTDLLLDSNETAAYYIEKLEGQKRLNETKSAAINDMNNHLLLQEKLDEFTQDLHDGKPCPLCGSEHHPAIMSVENVKESREANDQKLENVRRQNMLIDQTVRELNENLQSQKSLAVQIQSSTQRIQQEELALKLHFESYKWSNFNAENEVAFDEAFEKSKTASDEILALEKTLETLETKLQEAELNFGKFTKLLQEIKDEFTVKNTEKETIFNQVKTVDIQNISMDENTLNEQISVLEKHVLSVTEKHDTLSKKIIDQQQQQSVLKERLELTQKSLAESAEQLEKINRELAENLANSEFNDLEEISALLKKEIDPKALREEINEFRQHFYKSQQDVSELEKQTAGKQFNEQVYAVLVEQIRQSENIVQIKHDFHVTETALLQKMKADFAQKEALLVQMDNFTRRAANIQTMKSLFKGSGFVNYISTVYLQNLCEMANIRFYKLTRQQLRLEIGEGNEFQVRDFLNDGKIRSVKTLSGGQMFQAALSLALALAESIQQQSQAKQNFFFLDEGFGSQDKVSLQMVFDSLKALREENRVIGVISHVEDLQQEIDMYLKLENNPETGSKIEQSWT